MTPPSPEPHQPPAIPPPGGSSGPNAPDSWASALADLLSARLLVLRHEAKEAGRGLARMLVLAAAAALSAVFAWLLLVAGAVATVVTLTGCHWYWAAFGAAALHLIAALVCFRLAKAGKITLFPLTRAEFEKDRSWLNPTSTRPK